MDISDSQIPGYCRRGLIVDTQLLVLLLVGVHDQKLIETHYKTANYSFGDFEIIERLVSIAGRVIITPQILAELSNLTFGKPHVYGGTFEAYVSSVVASLKSADEAYIEKSSLLEGKWLASVGFTDVSIIEAAKQLQCLVVTDDFELFRLLEAEKCGVLNFTHLRASKWKATSS